VGVQGLIILVWVLLWLGWLSLPIVALVRTRKIRKLELRLSGVEAALLRVMRQQAGAEPPVAVPPPPPEIGAASATRDSTAAPGGPRPAENLETLVGGKWVGWVAICLIFGATAYFLKYAFENRWIGELGRVTLGLPGDSRSSGWATDAIAKAGATCPRS